jgi:hypothetical protein
MDWQSLFAVLLCGGTVRMTVEYYETLRETLIWKALKYGKRENALPGIRKIQRAIMPLMRSSFYARSEVVALRKRNSGTDNVCVVAPNEWAILDPSEWAILDTCMLKYKRIVLIFPLNGRVLNEPIAPSKF